MRNIQKLFALFCAALLLAACGGGGSSSGAEVDANVTFCISEERFTETVLDLTLIKRRYTNTCDFTVNLGFGLILSFDPANTVVLAPGQAEEKIDLPYKIVACRPPSLPIEVDNGNSNVLALGCS